MMTDPPAPAKRRRGRPRKDGNLSRENSVQSIETSSSLPKIYPTLESIKKTQEFDRNMRDENMIGNIVYGVIEGCFDAGYLISVTIGTNSAAAPYRGVVFQPTKIVPVTPGNDLAPQATMHERQQQQPVCVPNQMMQPAKQPVFRAVSPSYSPYPTTNQSNSIFRSNSCSDLGQKIVDRQSLRMVEEDEVMQAFEVSSSSKWIDMNTNTNGDIVNSEIHHTETLADNGNEPNEQDIKIRGHFEEQMTRSMFGTHQDELQRSDTQSKQQVPIVDFHQNPFVSQTQHGIATEYRPNLNLGYDSTIKTGFQEALVTGNPLLLPTNLMDDHIDFHKKPRSSSNIIVDAEEIRLGLHCGINSNNENIATNTETANTPTAHGGGMDIDLDCGAGSSYADSHQI